MLTVGGNLRYIKGIITPENARESSSNIPQHQHCTQTNEHSIRTVLAKVKNPTPPECRKVAIYRVKCAECPATYIEETGQNLTRIKVQRRRTAAGDMQDK